MTHLDEERTPEQVVDDLDVLSELEARDVFELADDTAEDSRASDLPTAKRRTWLTVRLALLITIGVVVIVAAIFRYILPASAPVNVPEFEKHILTIPAPAPPSAEQPSSLAAEVQAAVSDVYKWQLDYGENVRPRLMYTDHLYAVLPEGYTATSLVRLSAAGEEQWRHHQGPGGTFTFTTSGDVFALTSYTKENPIMLNALDSRGEVAWSYQPAGRVKNIVTSKSGDRVYLNCPQTEHLTLHNGEDYQRPISSVTALDGSGRELWHIEHEEHQRIADPTSHNHRPDQREVTGISCRYEEIDGLCPMLSDGVYAIFKAQKGSSMFNYIVAINSDGRELWDYAHPAAGPNKWGRDVEYRFNFIEPLDDGGLLVHAVTNETYSSIIFKLDSKGKLLWEQDLAGSSAGLPVIEITGKYAYVQAKRYVDAVSKGMHLVKVRLADGKVDYEVLVPGMSGFVVEPDGKVYASAHKGLMAIGPTGTVLWHATSSGGGLPVVGNDGTIYTKGNGIHATNPDGTERFTLKGERPDMGKLIVLPEGTVVYTEAGGKIKAIDG